MENFDSLITLSSSILEGKDPSASLVLGVRGMVLALYFSTQHTLVLSPQRSRRREPGSIFQTTGFRSGLWVGI